MGVGGGQLPPPLAVQRLNTYSLNYIIGGIDFHVCYHIVNELF